VAVECVNDVTAYVVKITLNMIGRV